ncbi:hypothetical protein [Lichenifustis flavocetrariae]|uniref:Uncharacterized protein n=1 Tax=Lichenifustis flavocetrariae TaxID=2949735 RepID=A0AA41YVZ2_9HYPH|nr:hypothetical protein [Lichenifustis flavocetrariae]MCW6507978.1 hypothetical protein [Lichenifustis flavocetrariae]
MTLTKTLLTAVMLTPLVGVPAKARVYNLDPYQGGAAAARYNYQRYGDTGYARDGDVRNTCVKLCRHDSNPCDPPAFKQADGRCEGPFD